jgi:phenylpropionate dioxygenase-like ring-hydroxylating dioxygenase large terminal subunit
MRRQRDLVAKGEKDMLSAAMNERLTRVGPGTPGGELMRRYWIPIAPYAQLLENPVRKVRILGEDLVLYRDKSGTLGLVGDRCLHRRVDLQYGIPDECGLRCPYHGWKFDFTGQCIEVPSEPEESGFAKKIKLKSYPLVERGGLLWTYMGPEQHKPPLPEWEFAMVPSGQRFVSKRLQESNWLQAMEGGIDSSHVSFLHRGNINSDPLFKGAKGNQYNLSDARPVFEVVESPGGLYIGARRNAEEGNYYWRITQWVIPSFTMIPPRGGHSVHGHFWIPIDDENCWAWSYDFHPTRELTGAEREAMRQGKGIHVLNMPGTFRPVANKDNDYLIDRAAQLRGDTYSGVEGIAMQDASLQESMGPVVDRSKENLVSTDNGIIMARHRLIQAAKALAERGERPPGVDLAHQRVRSAALILPPDQVFKDAAREALTTQPGTALATV